MDADTHTHTHTHTRMDADTHTHTHAGRQPNIKRFAISDNVGDFL